jgi:hypothetical protein
MTVSKRNWIERYHQAATQFVSLLALAVSFASAYFTWSQLPEDPNNIVQIVNREAEFARTKNLEAVVELFTEDAVIRDSGYSYNYRNFRSVRQWHGREQIRQRYEELNKNVEFETLNHVDVFVVFDPYGGMASATSSTQGTFRRGNQEVKPITTFDGDRWTFVRIDNKWKIKSFTFHRPPISDSFSGHIGSLR